MPTSLSSIFIIAFVLIPGLPGDKVYSIVIGRNWRADRWEKGLRIVGFSLSGLVIYSLVGLGLGAPVPAYLTVNGINSSLASPDGTIVLVVVLVAHIACSALSGILAGKVQLFLAERFEFIAQTSVWGNFVHECVHHHLVLVSLNTGDSYVGFLETAETAVNWEDRDLILQEPALRSSKTGLYTTLPYHHLFLPGRLVESITTLSNPETDQRITTIGQTLFEGEKEDE